jgi:dipeptidase D
MSSTHLDQLEPSGVWSHFFELTQIPRPPKHEEAVRAHTLAWASTHRFPAQTDDEGNVIVRVPATNGRENAPGIVLQAHLDMVCERNPDSPYDPREGRIHVVLEDDWLVADGTTLGADNGIGVATAMAIVEDPAVEHGPLELLFTVSEEDGLDGAKALSPELVTGRLLVNLDGGAKGITIGCAGSIHTFTRLALRPEPLPAGHVVLVVGIHGARGGHSGGDIASGRVNANKALGRVLSRAGAAAPFRLALLEGGVSRNAIPREAQAVVVIPAEAEARFREAAEQELAQLREQYAETDGGLGLMLEPGAADEAANDATTAAALDLIAVLPTGVLAMHPELPGTVETSTSLTVVSTDDGILTLGSMTRSASPHALEDVLATVESCARLTDAEVEVRRSYPPWRPEMGSRLLAVARKTYERVFESEPALTVVHGGLECAVIGGKLPGIEMISFGPQIEAPHAPGERLNVPSTQRCYRLLGALLDDLSR